MYLSWKLMRDGVSFWEMVRLDREILLNILDMQQKQGKEEENENILLQF